MQVRQLEHEADARFSQRPRELLSLFSQEANRALQYQREFFGDVSNNRSMEARRTNTWFTCRTQSPCTTFERHYAATNSKIRWAASALDRLGFRKHSNIEICLKNIELLNQPLDLQLIDFDEKRKNSCEQYDVTIMREHNLVLFYSGHWQTWNPYNNLRCCLSVWCYTKQAQKKGRKRGEATGDWREKREERQVETRRQRKKTSKRKLSAERHDIQVNI